MSKDPSNPSKKRKKDPKAPTKVTITFPSDEEHWEKALPKEHGK